MTLSVAIATYNRTAMAQQAIEAVLDQTRPPDEIVVTDDASTDSTWATLTELAGRHPRLRIFRRERNSGGVENWNFAIAQTCGDYIAWCSDDDRFMPSHLEASVEYLEAHPEVGLVHAGFVDVIEVEGTVQKAARRLRFPQTRIVTKASLIGYSKPTMAAVEPSLIPAPFALKLPSEEASMGFSSRIPYELEISSAWLANTGATLIFHVRIDDWSEARRTADPKASG